MGFLRSFFGLDDNNDDEKSASSTGQPKDVLFVTQAEENDFENSMYGKIQLYKTGVTYIKEIFPSEGYDLERQIELITKLLEQTNREDDPEIIDVFIKLEEQYMRMKRLADGEYTIKQLGQQNSAMDRRFEEAGLSDKPLTSEELEEFRKYIDLIQDKVNESDSNDVNPLLTKVQRQRFNSVSMQAEYRIKMLELMKSMRDVDYGNISREDIANPFKGLSDLKQRMFADYFLQDAHSSTFQYESISRHEELYKQFYFNIFPELDSMAKALDADIADASMVGDFSIRELFDSKNKSVNSFEFLKRFALFKLKLNDTKTRVATLDDMKAKKDKRDEDNRNKKAEAAAKQKAAEEARLAEEAREKAEKEAKEAEEKAQRLAQIEKYANMTPEEIEKEIYRIEHDLSAKGSRFVNILEFQKEVARKKGLLDTEAEVQRDDLTYKVLDITELEILLEQLDKVGTNYAVFPDSQEFRDGGYLVIVSTSDADKLKISNVQLPYNCLTSNYMEDEKFGKYPASVIKKLSGRLLAKYGEDFKSNLSVQMAENNLYDLSYRHYTYESRPRGYMDDRKKIRETLLEIKEELEYGNAPSSRLKDVLCYIELRANENIIPILEKMKKAEIPSFLEPIPTKNRNESNRDNIRIYFRRDDLPAYLEKVNDEMKSQRRYIPIKWGEDTSMERAVAAMSKWPSEKEKS